jgi:hypothetical protein
VPTNSSLAPRISIVTDPPSSKLISPTCTAAVHTDESSV